MLPMNWNSHICNVHGSAKRWTLGCVNTAGKAGQKWWATAARNFTNPGALLLADPCTYIICTCPWSILYKMLCHINPHSLYWHTNFRGPNRFRLSRPQSLSAFMIYNVWKGSIALTSILSVLESSQLWSKPLSSSNAFWSGDSHSVFFQYWATKHGF